MPCLSDLYVCSVIWKQELVVSFGAFQTLEGVKLLKTNECVTTIDLIFLYCNKKVPPHKEKYIKGFFCCL